MVYSLCRLNEQERKEYMAKYLVIVESPAKAKTIKKFLGSNYEVIASNGHVRDLPKSQMGIDVDNDFEPKYITNQSVQYTSRLLCIHKCHIDIACLLN